MQHPMSASSDNDLLRRSRITDFFVLGIQRLLQSPEPIRWRV